MSELLPALHPRRALDVRSADSVEPAHFLADHTLVYAVGRHLAVHTVDAADSAAGEGTASLLGFEHMQQPQGFLLRPFVDRPAHCPPVSSALGGPGVGSAANAHARTTGASALQRALGAEGAAALLPSSGSAILAPAPIHSSKSSTQSGAAASSSSSSHVSAAMVTELSARQHAAELSELLERESFAQDRTTLLSCFTVLASGVGGSSLSVADSAHGTGSVLAGGAGLRRNLAALGEFSRENRMAIVSVLDLRGMAAGAAAIAAGESSSAPDAEPRQVNCKDVATQRLFLPWSMLAENSVAYGAAAQGKRRRKKRTIAEQAQEEINHAEQQQAEEQAAAGSSSTATVPPASASASATFRAAAVPIESTAQSSSAHRILAHKHKDRSDAVREATNFARAAQRAKDREARRRARAFARAARRAQREQDGEARSDDEDSLSSSSSESSALDSEDEALLSDHEDESHRRDEDFDYEAAARMERAEEKAREAADASWQPTRFGDDSAASSAAPPVASAAGPNPALSRKLTTTLANAPIQLALATGFHAGLFQQPLPHVAAKQIAQECGAASSAAFAAAAVAAPSSFTKPVLLRFSHDGRFLACMLSGPRWPLVLWDWSFRSRMMGAPRWVRQEVRQMEWHPHDNSRLCVMGPRCFLEYKLQSGTKAQAAGVTSLVTLLNESESFASFTYLPAFPDAMVVAKTERIIVLNNSRVVQSIDVRTMLYTPVRSAAAALAAQRDAKSRALPNGAQPRIACVVPTAQGFAVGTAIHPLDSAYPFEAPLLPLGSKAPATDDASSATTPMTNGGLTGMLLLYEFSHSRTLDLTASTDASSAEEKVASTTIFDRSRGRQEAQNQSMQAFRTHALPLWRPHTAAAPAAAPLPFSLHHMAVSPNLQSLALTSSTRETLLVDLTAVDLLDSSSLDSPAAAMSLMRPLVSGLHAGAICCMDVAQELPLIVTLSPQDCSVRVWNYVDTETGCEMVKRFGRAAAGDSADDSEQDRGAPLTVAMHPMGHEILVGFARQVVQYRLLLASGEFVARAEIGVCGASALRYSPSGAYIAAATSNKDVRVYASNTLKSVALFRGHSDVITAITWATDESAITSVGAAGCVYTWSLAAGRLAKRDYVNHALSYSDVLALPDGNIVALGVAAPSVSHNDWATLLFPKSVGFNQQEHDARNKQVGQSFTGSRPATASRSDDARSSFSSEAAPPAFKFFIQWNQRPSSASEPRNVNLGAALSYVQYHSDDSALVAHPFSSRLGSPSQRRKDEAARAAASAQVAKPEGENIQSIDSLRTVELPIRPYLPVASSFHSRVIANAAAALAAEQASQASRSSHRPMSARAARGSVLTASAAVSTASALHHLSASAAVPRPQSAALTKRQHAVLAADTLSAFLHPGGEADEPLKDECPIPPLLHGGMVTVGRTTFLLVGTPRGTVQTYQWPMHVTQTEPLSETALHSEPITALRVCQKTQCVITTSLDGSLFISSLALILNTALGSNAAATAVGGSSPSDAAPLANHMNSPSASAYVYGSAVSQPAHSLSYVFPAHLFLAKSFFPPLFGLLSPPRLRSEIFGEQRRLLEEAEASAPERLKQERLLYGTRRMEGLDHEFEFACIDRGLFKSLLSERDELKAQVQRMASEWESKAGRDALAINARLDSQTARHQSEKRELQTKESLLLAAAREKDESRRGLLAQKAHEHHLTVIHLENLYEKKLSLESARYAELMRKMKDMEMRATVEGAKKESSAVRELEAVKTKHAQEVASLQKQLRELGDRSDALRAESVAMLDREAHQASDDLAVAVLTAANQQAAFAEQTKEQAERTSRFHVQAAQGRMKIDLASQLQREAELARDEAKKELAEIVKKNAQLVAMAKTAEESAVASAAALSKSTAEAALLLSQKLELRAQVQHLLDSAAANHPAKTLAEWDRTVTELGDEVWAEVQTNNALSKASAQSRSTIASLSAEVASLKRFSKEREQLLSRLREDVAGMKDIRALREKYFQALALSSAGSGSAGTTGASSGAMSLAQAASASVAHAKQEALESKAINQIELEYTRQTRKNHSTIAHLEAKARSVARKLTSVNAGQIQENEALLLQTNELRYVNRDFKAEIVRLSGEVAHQKLQMKALGVGQAAAGGPLSSLIQARRAQVAAAVASAAEPVAPSASAQKIGELNDLLLVERYTRASAEAEAATARELLHREQASRAVADSDPAAHFAALAQAHEEMLVNSYRRISEQDEEIRALRAKETAKQQMAAAISSPRAAASGPLYAAFQPTTTRSASQSQAPVVQPAASAAASYVDSVIERAAQLRSQFQSVGGDHDDLTSYSNSQAASRPSSALFAAHASTGGGDGSRASSAASVGQGVFTSSIGVPPRSSGTAAAFSRSGGRPQTAMVRGPQTAAAGAAAGVGGAGVPVVNRPSSAVLAAASKGSRAARNWNASTASTRTASMDSSMDPSLQSTAAPTPTTSARGVPMHQQPPRGAAGSQTARARPSRALPRSTPAAASTAAASSMATAAAPPRSMVSTWMESHQPTPPAHPPPAAAASKPAARPSSAHHTLNAAASASGGRSLLEKMDHSEEDDDSEHED